MKLLHAVRASCVSLALVSMPLAFAQAPRAAGRRHASHGRRRHHRVPARQRPASTAVPRPVEGDDHGQHDVPRRLADESYGETGMAHLLEHMLFKGSTKYPDILAAIRSRGAQFNGTTSWDRTNYFETFDASDANLEWALDLEADRMVNAFVAQKDLDTEMTVVRNEFEPGENDPLGVLFERVLSHGLSCGTATASRRSAAAATSRTCRSSACRRSTNAITNPTTPCSSSPAASRSAQALDAHRRATSARSRDRSASSIDNYTDRADAGRRARSRSCAASATCRS